MLTFSFTKNDKTNQNVDKSTKHISIFLILLLIWILCCFFHIFPIYCINTFVVLIEKQKKYKNNAFFSINFHIEIYKILHTCFQLCKAPIFHFIASQIVGVFALREFNNFFSSFIIIPLKIRYSMRYEKEFFLCLVFFCRNRKMLESKWLKWGKYVYNESIWMFWILLWENEMG